MTLAGRLKTWPGDLDQIASGAKRAEVRRCDDRNFRVGQVWELYAWDPDGHQEIFTFPRVRIRITHIERMAGPICLAVGGIPLAVLSLEIV